MIIWIVIVEDRHSDVDAFPFASEQAAEAAAYRKVPDDAELQDLLPGMVRDGWVLYLRYGTEGDCVRVIKRELDGMA